jgi:hypothetical protein
LAAFFRNLREMVERHLGCHDDDASFWADRLMSHGLLNGFAYEVTDGPKDLKALQRVDRALMELGRACSDAAISFNALAGIERALMLGPFLDVSDAKEEDVEAYMQTHGRANHDAFTRIVGQTAAFRKAVSSQIEDVKSSPYAKRSLTQINAEAIGLVQGCRWVWEASKGRPAPLRDLNPGSKFAAFLADAMETCGIEGEPVPAFRAWAREQKRRP